MPYILMVAIQVALAIHAIRTGQDRYWIFIILVVPGLGCLVYFLAIMLPDLFNRHDSKRLLRKAHNKLMPERQLQGLFHELSISETSQNYVLVGDELMNRNRSGEAV